MSDVTIQQALDSVSVDRLDAQLILAHVLSKPRSYLISWPDKILSQAEFLLFGNLVQKRATGYPLAYITGVKSFWDMELHVTPDVLIPRPETELLVELALERLPANALVLELATGSGAITCALARERSDLKITATDISPQALMIAQENAKSYDLNHINFIESDWFTNIPHQTFDLILANPPYLSDTDSHLSTDIRFEPRSALVSGKNGDEDLVKIISQAKSYLKKNGWLLIEHGCDQGPRARELFQECEYVDIFTKKDIAGLERCSAGRIA